MQTGLWDNWVNGIYTLFLFKKPLLMTSSNASFQDGILLNVPTYLLDIRYGAHDHTVYLHARGDATLLENK